MFSSDDYSDSDKKWQELEEKGLINKNIDKPSSSDIHDYYNKKNFKEGRDYREYLFHNLLEPEQRVYARQKQMWLKEFQERGFDVNDHDIQDIADYHAGQYIINWLNNLSEESVKKHYYYRQHYFKKFLYDSNKIDDWLDIDFSMDEFFDDFDFFGDLFGN